MSSDNIILEVKNLKKYYPVTKGILKRVVAQVKAVDGVDLFIKENETLGLVGESGCGKTTLGRAVLQLVKPTAGEITFKYKKHNGVDDQQEVVNVTNASREELRKLRRYMQIVFQDPYSSLDPRMTIGTIVQEPLVIQKIGNKSEREDRVRQLLTSVGLSSDHFGRYPHEFSGGQRQRIGIARSLALGPKLIIADEPVSALDVSIQAQILNLLDDLQSEFGLTYLFIAHNLSVIKYVSDRVAVMYLGKIVELAKTDELFADLKHPYTEALMSAIPIPDPDYKMDRILLEGDVPSPVNPPSGCNFHPRCRYAKEVCKIMTPVLRDLNNEHYVACHLTESLNLRSV